MEAKLSLLTAWFFTMISFAELNDIARFIASVLAIACSVVYLVSKSKDMKEKVRQVMQWLK